MVMILSVVLIIGGLFFFLTSTVGLLRFPDFYCRAQATGKGDTLGALFCLSGIALYQFIDGFTVTALLVSIKILFICFFIFIANPTATHAIARAGMNAGVAPLTSEDLKR